MSIVHEYPEAPKEGQQFKPPRCTKQERCAALAIAIAGSKGSEVGLAEAWLMADGYKTQIAYRFRVANKGRAKKYITIFLTTCPFCGHKLHEGVG